MTVPSPYAVLHEALRRLRIGEDAADLVASRAVLSALQGLNVEAGDARLVPEQETSDAITVLDTRNQHRYRAVVRESRIVSFEMTAN